MYWLVILILSIVLWIGLKRLYRNRDSIAPVPLFWVIFGLLGGCFALAIGCDLPQIYVVNAKAETKYRKLFAVVPWVKYSIDGVEFRAQPGSTYIINAARVPLVTAEVSYTDDEDLIGKPCPVMRDTCQGRLLEYPNASVVVFEDAPIEMETLSELKLGIRSIQMVVFPWQDCEGLHETCYRPIRKSDWELVDISRY